jgi:hypothetical protein
MAIPTELETAVRSAVNAWKENDPAMADHHFKKAADLAKKIGYL